MIESVDISLDMRDISTGKSVKQLAEMFQSHILEKKRKEEKRDRSLSRIEGKNRPRDEAETDDNLDTTVLSIKESFTEPIIIEAAAIDSQSNEKTVPEESCQIEAKVEVHSRDDSRALGRNKEKKKKRARSARPSANSEEGVLFEDEEKVCVATSASGSKKRTFSRPEVE